MILNGLGFSESPLSLTPQFFETKALALLFREGIEAENFNRHKLGKVLDRIHEYGCENLFFACASKVCFEEKVDLKFNSLNTTTFSVSEVYENTSSKQISITWLFKRQSFRS